MGTGVHGVDTGRAPFPSSRSRPGDQRARPSGARFGLFYLLGVGKAGHPTYAVQHPTQRASGRRFGALVVRGAVPTGGRPRGHSSLTPLTASILSVTAYCERKFKPRSSAADSDGRGACRFSVGASPHLRTPYPLRPASSLTSAAAGPPALLQLRRPVPRYARRRPRSGRQRAFVGAMTTMTTSVWQMMMRQWTCRYLLPPGDNGFH